MRWIGDFLLGRNWGQRGIIIGTAGLYLYLFIFRPKDAMAASAGGMMMFMGLLTLVSSVILYLLLI